MRVVRRRIAMVGIVLAVGCSACSGSDSDDGGATSSQSDSVSTTAGTSGDTAPGTTAAGTADPAPAETTAAPVAVPPSGVPLVAGMDRVDVVGPPHGGAGEAPLFEWMPVAGATAYDLVVLGPGGPVWAWRGPETEVWLGGLPFERPPGMSGPVIADGSCWSVVALDDAGHAIAASDFLAVSPGGASGHQCVPGSES